VANAPRVDFYVLETAGLTGRLNFVCRLAEKAYGTLEKIYAHTESSSVAGQLDQLLWTFRQGSFIPHELLQDSAPRAPISIGTQQHALESGELLINLTSQVPAFAKQFTRIAEIIDRDEQVKAAGRQRYVHYKGMGIEPVTHNI
jgi:DNA polymerase-3 subunit chi